MNMLCRYFLPANSRGKQPHQESYYRHGVRRLMVSPFSPNSGFWLHFCCIQHLEHQDTLNHSIVCLFMEKSSYIFTHNIVFQPRNTCLCMTYCLEQYAKLFSTIIDMEKSDYCMSFVVHQPLPLPTP